jgi:hypothetical protein
MRGRLNRLPGNGNSCAMAGAASVSAASAKAARAERVRRALVRRAGARAGFDALSTRQREKMLEHLVPGHSNKEIARALGMPRAMSSLCRLPQAQHQQPHPGRSGSAGAGWAKA